MYEIIFDDGHGRRYEVTLNERLRVVGHHPDWTGMTFHKLLTTQFHPEEGWDITGKSAGRVWEKYLRQVRDCLNKQNYLAAIHSAAIKLGM